jgi:hypothetical protein
VDGGPDAAGALVAGTASPGTGGLLDAGGLLTTGALDAALGEDAVDAVDAEFDAAAVADESGLDACELELLLHPAKATETDTAMSAGDQIQERENRRIDQRSAREGQNLDKHLVGRR